MTWSVPKSWPGETCIILAGGPSLRRFDVTSIPRNRARVIAINDAWRICPWADVLYFCDENWWHDQVKYSRIAADSFTRFTDTIFRNRWVKGGDGFDDHPNVRTLRFTGQRGLEMDPTALRHGSNSGYAAINLAYHFGVKRILLMGYDMQVQDFRTHWHDEEREPASRFAQTLAGDMLPNFATLVEPLKAAGVEVVNCTPGSALACWPYLSLEDALHGTQTDAQGG